MIDTVKVCFLYFFFSDIFVNWNFTNERSRQLPAWPFQGEGPDWTMLPTQTLSAQISNFTAQRWLAHRSAQTIKDRERSLTPPPSSSENLFNLCIKIYTGNTTNFMMNIKCSVKGTATTFYRPISSNEDVMWPGKKYDLITSENRIISAE